MKAQAKRLQASNIQRAENAKKIISDGTRTGDTRVCPECHRPIAWKHIEALHTDYGTFFTEEQVYEIVHGCVPVSLWSEEKKEPDMLYTCEKCGYKTNEWTEIEQYPSMGRFYCFNCLPDDHRVNGEGPTKWEWLHIDSIIDGSTVPISFDTMITEKNGQYEKD